MESNNGVTPINVYADPGRNNEIVKALKERHNVTLEDFGLTFEEYERVVGHLCGNNIYENIKMEKTSDNYYSTHCMFLYLDGDDGVAIFKSDSEMYGHDWDIDDRGFSFECLSGGYVDINSTMMSYIVSRFQQFERDRENLYATEEIDTTQTLLDKYGAVLTTDEVADFLSLSKHTVIGYRRRGIGPKYSRLGRSIRYQLFDVMSWRDSNVVAQQ